jgi:surface protein
MFWYCYVLSTLDVSNFETFKVTDMSRMFSDCFQLEELNLISKGVV